MLLERADRAYEAGADARAIRHYRGYLAQAPDSPRVWYRFGNALARDGQLRPAQEALEQALTLDPALAEAKHNLGLVHMQLAWKALLAARRNLPESDTQSAGTMRYLGCLMATFAGETNPGNCRHPSQQE